MGAVSVVIPTKDRAHFLAASLRSALAQEGVDLEVLVVDDGSAAGSLDRVPGLDDPRVRRLAAHGRGVAHARNVGIAAAAAPWVAFLDDDDFWAPDKLRRQLATAERTRADFVYCGLVVVEEAGLIVAVKPAADGADPAGSLLEGNLVRSPSTVLVRTEALRAVGGFDEGLAVLADWDLWLRLAESCRLAACPECLVAYREHAGNMSVSQVRSIDAELARLRRRHSGWVAPHRGDRSGLAVEHWMAAGFRRSGQPVEAARRYLRAGIRCRSPGSVARALLSLAGPQGAHLARWVRVRREPPPPAWLGRRAPPAPVQRRNALALVRRTPSEPRAARARVAVLIPCFNAGELLWEAVSSLGQEEPIELLVIDDASDDPATRRVLDALEAGGTRILRHATNQGAAAARTAGLALTSAPYVFPLDADDLAVPGAITEAADRLDAAPDAVACVGHYQEFGRSRFVRQVPDVLDPYRLAYNNDYPVTSLFRRTALERAGGWRDPIPEQPAYEDWNLWMSLAETGGRIVHLGPDRVIYWRRLHSPAFKAPTERPHADLYRALRAGHPELFGRMAEHRRSSGLGPLQKLAYPLLFGERRRVRGQRAIKPWLDRAGLWTGRR